MNKHRKAVIEANSVSMIEEFNLGGYPQKVLIEGKSEDLPIVITLHGGPGSPIPFCVGARGLFPEFTDNCILVSWDQYGCGINNAKLPDDISINDFVDMTIDLIKEIKGRFPQNAVWLFGMSWGSVLSAIVAKKTPELIDGVITYGQVLYQLMQSKETIDALMNSKAPEKTKVEIKTAVDSKVFNNKTAMKLSGAIRKYTYGYNNPNEPKAKVGKMLCGIMASPDYKFRDFKAIVINGYMKNTSLMKELSKLDLRETLKSVSVPYHIIQGETDVVTCTSSIITFVEEVNNPYLTCTVIPNSAHIPGMNGMRAVFEEICKLNNTLSKLIGNCGSENVAVIGSSDGPIAVYFSADCENKS